MRAGRLSRPMTRRTCRPAAATAFLYATRYRVIRSLISRAAGFEEVMFRDVSEAHREWTVSEDATAFQILVEPLCFPG